MTMTAINSVVFSRNPAQIFGAVVESISINVIHLWEIVRIAQKSLSNKPMNISCLTPPKSNPEISGSIFNWLKEVRLLYPYPFFKVSPWYVSPVSSNPAKAAD